MELQIQDLVSSIKKEGIEAANAEAEKIISQANAKAAQIVADANEKAKKVTEEAQREIQVLRESASVSAKQALRDAGISFGKEVKSQFEKILSAEIKKAVSSETLCKIIVAAISDEDPSKYTVEINEVSDAVKSELASQIKAGLEIKVAKNIGFGFRLSAKDGSGYFDLSDDEITQIVSSFMGEIRI